MAVAVTIDAAVYLTPKDVRVQKRSGDDVAHGSQVVAGDTLTVTAEAFDFERLPAARAALHIPVTLSCKKTSLNVSTALKLKFGNTYIAELQSSWVEEPGPCTLVIDGGKANGAVTLDFEVTKTNLSIFVAAGIGGVRAYYLWQMDALRPLSGALACAFCVCQGACRAAGGDGLPVAQEPAPREGVPDLFPEFRIPPGYRGDFVCKQVQTESATPSFMHSFTGLRRDMGHLWRLLHDYASRAESAEGVGPEDGRSLHGFLRRFEHHVLVHNGHKGLIAARKAPVKAGC
jgi:hypothetical protein